MMRYTVSFVGKCFQIIIEFVFLLFSMSITVEKLSNFIIFSEQFYFKLILDPELAGSERILFRICIRFRILSKVSVPALKSSQNFPSICLLVVDTARRVPYCFLSLCWHQPVMPSLHLLFYSLFCRSPARRQIRLAHARIRFALSLIVVCFLSFPGSRFFLLFFLSAEDMVRYLGFALCRFLLYGFHFFLQNLF